MLKARPMVGTPPRPKSMKIIVATTELSVTGVPLAQKRLAGALARAGHDVMLLFGWIPEDAQIGDIDGVRLISFGQRRASAMFRPLARLLRQEQPDILFVAEDHLVVIALAAAIATGSKTRISGSSRIPPSQAYSSTWFTKRWLLKQSMKAVMWRANALTCVSGDMAAQYRNIFPGSPHQGVYNIFGDAESMARARQPIDDPWLNERGDTKTIVSAGSLHKNKGFQDLIAAVALLRSKGRDVRLLILGEGYFRRELEAATRAAGVEQWVRMLGQVDNPLPYFAKADLFALASYTEGMPNVLVEAMMCGTTPVATDCPTGPREVLKDGRYGYLATVGDIGSIAAAIEQGLDHPIAPALLQEAIEPFSEQLVIARHFQLLGLAAPE